MQNDGSKIKKNILLKRNVKILENIFEKMSDKRIKTINLRQI
jgi:hypothetical protein